MFLLLMSVIMILTLIGLIYLLARFRKFQFMQHLAEKNRWLTWVLSAVPLLIMIAFARYDFINTIIVVLHLIIFWVFSDFVGFLVYKLAHKQYKIYWQSILAVLLTVIYLSFGWFFAHHVYETHYELTTEKNLGTDTIRIVQVSDSHIGATFDGEGFARHMERVQNTNPDIVVITGDYVDDDTTKKDMVTCCAALGNLKTTYGVYFSFGNHDKGYFGYRDFSEDDLRKELIKNNIQILEDEAVLIGEHICLVGRQDRSEPGRKSASELMEGIDETKYTIFLDHQPHDFDAETKAGVDLVLCGHTHGGQMFPVGITGELSGANEKTYGLEVREHTTFIVNSGISDWAVQFKTATISEYGVIDIKQHE